MRRHDFVSPDVHARDLMTSEPVYCTPEMPLLEVARLLAEHDCGAIPVVDDDVLRQPVGVITDRDIVCRALAAGRDPRKLKAQDCMTGPCVVTATDSLLDDCCEAMEANQIRRLVVVDDDGRLAGIIAQADIARMAPDRQAVEVLREISLSSQSLQATF